MKLPQTSIYRHLSRYTRDTHTDTHTPPIHNLKSIHILFLINIFRKVYNYLFIVFHFRQLSDSIIYVGREGVGGSDY